MFTATKKQQHYLKQLAALQFPGSIDNLSTRMPIYALEQQLPKDDTMKLDDAVIEGQDIDYSKFYDEDGCSYSSVSELVEVQLGLDDDDSIREYNEENPDLPYIPYEKLREMDKKDIPELLLSVVDEADYVDAYKEVTDIASYNVEVVPMSSNYATMGFAFTQQELKSMKSLSTTIFSILAAITRMQGRNLAEKRVTSILSWSLSMRMANSFWLTTLSGSMSR